VNLTKLRQLDLSWNADKCSADLRLTGPVVSKVSEAHGDYSTVLAAQGGCVVHCAGVAGCVCVFVGGWVTVGVGVWMRVCSGVCTCVVST
jgi:hypothetical protein